jgi:hypothetical protein
MHRTRIDSTTSLSGEPPKDGGTSEHARAGDKPVRAKQRTGNALRH